MKLCEIKQQFPFFSVTWPLSNMCNYNCSYCTDINKKGNHKLDFDDAIKVVDAIFANENHNLFTFLFSGGEPTVWKHFTELCEYIRVKEAEDYYQRVLITANTNFSRSKRWWIENCHLIDFTVASFHIEFADQDEFIDKILAIDDKTVIAVRLNMYKERFWDVVSFGKRLEETEGNFCIEWVPLFDELGINSAPFEYTDEEQKKFLKEHASPFEKQTKRWKKLPRYMNEVIAYYEDEEQRKVFCNEIVVNEENFFQGWECRLGVDSLFISFEGDLEGATCRKRKLGHITDPMVILPSEPMICPKEYCHCGADILIPKKKGMY